MSTSECTQPAGSGWRQDLHQCARRLDSSLSRYSLAYLLFQPLAPAVCPGTPWIV